VGKTELIKLELLMDPVDPASKYSRQFVIFKDGCPEEWIKLLMAFREIENLLPLKEPADRTKIFRASLKDQTLAYFEYHIRKG
jgi:hypothetical protein